MDNNNNFLWGSTHDDGNARFLDKIRVTSFASVRSFRLRVIAVQTLLTNLWMGTLPGILGGRQYQNEKSPKCSFPTGSTSCYVPILPDATSFATIWKVFRPLIFSRMTDRTRRPILNTLFHTIRYLGTDTGNQRGSRLERG